MIRTLLRAPVRLTAGLALMLVIAGCAAATSIRRAHDAERLQDYDLAVVEYAKAVRLRPNDAGLKRSLEVAKLRASTHHFERGRRHAAVGKFEEALVEYQIAWELNPTSGDVDQELRATRLKLRNKIAVREGKTDLQSLVERARELPPPGLDLPQGLRLPDNFSFRSNGNANSRAIFTALARFAGVNVIFDPAFRDAPVSVDFQSLSFEDALNALAASTHNFYRVAAQRTITIIPDTPAKRREYEEEIVRTFPLSNADLKETLDLLRVVIDLRRLSPTTAMNAITIKDTPERMAAAARVISAIDKARPEVVIDTELLEVDRTKLLDYGLQIASAGTGPTGISGTVSVDETDLTLRRVRSLTSSDVFLAGVPALYYRLLKSDTATRTLANPQLRTSDGIGATARFGDRVPIPVTTFAPIATGGVQQQPITSFTYENIGVNIDITPRTHHDDDVTLALKIEVSSLSGTGFANLPTFGNRQISTQIRLRDGETNMLAGLIRDEERRLLDGVPGLSDLPVIGRMFARNRRERTETDIVLMLTPHIVRVLDLSEADLQPFRVGRDAGAPLVELPVAPERDFPQPVAPGTLPPGAPTGTPMAPILPPPTTTTTTTTTTTAPPLKRPR